METETTKTMPNPGSNEAIALGCRCPILDNAHGIGYMGQSGVFCFTSDCPLHGDGIYWTTIKVDSACPDQPST